MPTGVTRAFYLSLLLGNHKLPFRVPMSQKMGKSTKTVKETCIKSPTPAPSRHWSISKQLGYSLSPTMKPPNYAVPLPISPLISILYLRCCAKCDHAYDTLWLTIPRPTGRQTSEWRVILLFFTHAVKAKTLMSSRRNCATSNIIILIF